MKDTEIKYRNKRYHITGTPYSFDNYKTAEMLQKDLKHNKMVESQYYRQLNRNKRLKKDFYKLTNYLTDNGLKWNEIEEILIK